MKKSILKKALSLTLALVMMFSLTSVAFATSDAQIPVIVIGGMNATGLYSSETYEFVFPPSDSEIDELINNLASSALTSLVNFDFSILADGLASELYDMFEIVSCDENGVPLYDEVTTSQFDYPISYYTYFDDSTLYQQAVARALGDEIGEDSTYFFNYDWRLSPLDHADDLNTMIESAKLRAGTDEVRLVCCSMGATVASAYIYEYGSDSIDSITYASSAIGGVDLVGNLLSGEIEMTSNSVLTYISEVFKTDWLASDSLGVAITALDTFGLIETAIDEYLALIIDELSDPVYEECLFETFATMYGVWSLVPAEYYEAAKTFVSASTDLSDEFFEKTDEYIYEVQMNIDDLLLDAQENGVNVYIVGSYGYTGVPATSSYSSYSDILIDSDNMLLGCSVANYGETLSDLSYVASLTCDDETHTHISTDNIIDASTAVFPETTWAIKNMTHCEYKYETVPCDVIVWLASCDEAVTVYSNELYPQFMQYNESSNTFSSLTQGVELAGDSIDDSISIFDKIMELINRIIAFFNDIFNLDI